MSMVSVNNRVLEWLLNNGLWDIGLLVGYLINRFGNSNLGWDDVVNMWLGMSVNVLYVHW